MCLAVESALHAHEFRLALGQLNAFAQLHYGFVRFRSGNGAKRHLQGIGQILCKVIRKSALQFVRCELDAINPLPVVAFSFILDAPSMMLPTLTKPHHLLTIPMCTTIRTP